MNRILAAFTFSLFLLAAPFVSLAQTGDLNAGFAKSSIWMARSHVIGGESVNIFTVVYNSSENSIAGEAVIDVDGSSIGTKNFTLASGETKVISLPWVAKAGTHTLSARMEKVVDVRSNTNLAISDSATESITVTIEAPPPPSAAEQVLNTVTSAIQTGIASGTPAVMSAAGKVFDATESLRMQAKSALEHQLAETPLTRSEPPAINRALNSDKPSDIAAPTIDESAQTSAVSNALRYLAAAGLTVVSSKTLFYISLGLMLLALIQILRVALRERKRRSHLSLD